MRLIVVVALCSCTQLYGLDGTTVAEDPPPPPDLDGDGAEDLVDNCLGVANPDQADEDKDGFGDACDLCFAQKTASNHDEDADARGDDCDLCPIEPDFQMDGDGDGVGNTCDNDFATQNHRLLFDPFLALGPHWQQSGTWSLLGDAVAATTPDAVLQAPSIVLTGRENDEAEIIVGLTTTAPLAAGDRFAVQLVDGGNVVAGCVVACSAQLSCVLSDEQAQTSLTISSDKPVADLILRRSPTLQTCIYAGNATDDGNARPIAFTQGSVRLVGSPKIQFRYISVTQ